MRRVHVAWLLVTFVGLGGGLLGCGGRPATAFGADDGGAASDGGQQDAREQTDGIITGRACSADALCGTGYTCWPMPPGGYCLVGPPTTCFDSNVCPAGTRCSPLPMSQMAGVCLLHCATDADCRPAYRCAIVELFPGEPGSPTSDGKVCWTRPVCTPGQDQTCNDDPLLSSLHGYCQPDGSCLCTAGYDKNPATGKCR